MKMKKWFKCLLMTMALMMVVNAGVVGTTIPAAAKAKTETVKVGKKFKKGKFQYKVTSLSGKTGTAALVGTKSKGMTSATVPDTVKLKGYTLTVTEIGANAFKNCKKLKSVTTNTKIKKIGKNAFAGCKKLEAMNIKSTALGSVGKNAFKGISKSAVVTAPAGTDYSQMLKVPVKTPAPAPLARPTEKETEKALQAVTPATAPKAETEAQTQTEPATEAPETEAETEAQAQTEPATEAPETEAETEAQAQTEPATEAPKPESNATPEPAPKRAPQVESKAAPAQTKPLCSEGHLYGEWTVVQAATCTTPGTEERICTVCEAKETKTVAATGHTLGEPEIVPIPGSNCYGREVRECTSCDYVQKSNYSVHRQDVMQHLEDIPATCTASGKTRRSYCPYCGAENFAWVKPLGHEYSAEWTTEEGTCVKAGIRYHKCVHDGCTAKADVQETVKAEGHQWVDASIAATCTAAGFDGQKCALCGELKGKEVQPLGHEYKTTVTAATCIKDGAKKTTCSRCGKTETTVLPASGEHQWVTHKEVAATCSTTGHSAYTQCELCGEYKDGAEPKTYAANGEHRWVSVRNTPFAFASINAVNTLSSGHEHVFSDIAKSEMTYFDKCCEDCGVYEVIPGSGLKTLPFDAGHICWVVFLSETAWDTTAFNYKPLYSSRVIMNDGSNKQYNCYVIALRGEENLFSYFANAPVPKGRSSYHWTAVGDPSRTINVGENGTLIGFEKTDIGRTFIVK